MVVTDRESGVLSTTGELMSLEAFYGVIWGFFALCVIVFIGRIWIRWISFGKFLKEDYLMFFVLCLQLSTTIICQLRLHYVYMMEEVGNGLIAPPPTFLEDVPKGLRGLLASQVITVVGLWGVKFNFLLFFYRIFCRAARRYQYLWWAVVVVTIMCFAAFIGLMSYKCEASDVTIILSACTQPSAIRLEWIQVQTTSAIDVFNDILIMIFPIAILWGVRITPKKKVYLTLMFMLTLFTVAMAIIRGTISYGRVASDYSQSQNISWVWFWFQMEFIVSFLVACLVSFQSLFTQTKKKGPRASPPVRHHGQPPTIGGSSEGRKKRSRNIYDSIVETCIDLENAAGADSTELEGTTWALSELGGQTQGESSSFANSSHERLSRNWLNKEAWVDNRTAENVGGGTDFWNVVGTKVEVGGRKVI
ncbi:hypothetical protein G7Y89_g14295 [Cudoniella acicularis]|uniref:Rhodopsin domain-containing protein n=1 Tax=Cudoniella acicularis TaxID=354080 RepID=A0A8H4R5U5_9HELO|nr:hypothetical protein G7Y89_g14295 [Cudoniella acicularis]